MIDPKCDFQPRWQFSREMFLDDKEVAQLLAFVRRTQEGATERARALAVRDRLIIESLLFSGLRNSELCGLRICDTILGTGESVFLVRGTPRQDRTVYVPQSVSLLVQQFVHVDRTVLIRRPIGGKKVDRESAEKPLMVNDRGKPFERTSLYRRVIRILEATGLGDRASVQLLRHTYGYLGYKRSGGNLLFLQHQMGHAHPMVTSVYAQFVDESYAEIANRVGQGSLSPQSRTSPQRQNLGKELRDVQLQRNPQSRPKRRR